MKKLSFGFLCFILMCFLISSPAYGDIGPKPSVVIDFIGLEGKTYYVTLLSSVKTTGPYTAVKEGNISAYRYKKGDRDYDIFMKFVDYKDKDGFYFLQFFQDCTQTHRFSWTYYPPNEFKILIYFPDTDCFIVSDRSFERYAFDSYFTANVSETKITVKKSYDYTSEIISLIIRIVLTIGIESGIALLFGFREKKLIYFIVLVNIITQILLNFGLNIINFLYGNLAFIAFYILAEIMVFILEAILYTWYMKKHSIKSVSSWKAVLYAFVGNGTSFILGMYLAFWLPAIF